ncbi:MAG TPA: hypothetical protein VM012_00700 [Flavitalea sp.]|nr:hypothetical protein [Flavitalea sp.]
MKITIAGVTKELMKQFVIYFGSETVEQPETKSSSHRRLFISPDSVDNRRNSYQSKNSIPGGGPRL